MTPIQRQPEKIRAMKHGRDWWVEPKEVERYRRDNRRSSSPSSGDSGEGT